MQRERRLTRARELSAVLRSRKGWSDPLLVLKALPNTLEVSRFAFSVGRRVGKAVVRNKVKRRLRGAARLTRVKTGWDLVFIARRDTASADYHRLRRSLVGLLRRARILA